MSTFKIERRIGVQTSAERIWALIADLPYWDRWNPVETQVEGRIGFGGSLTLTETIPALGERRATLGVAEWTPESQLILTEKRGFLFHAVRYFEIEQLQPQSCIVANGFIFRGFRGEGFHEKNRRHLKAACEAVAESLKAHAEAG
ncbi:polyketide cyclase [Brevundimonas sp. AAP58]|uniref:SRPBCC domain-containing protein n=1 Tax=Brevundimonas sp. AAP58 TaxID=1523422 RepID=UPI0006B94C18|nr:SRPBCC domain-containing protein [Brevundimonas sp. AAP58]KPF81020.1 polyketide cyclase [Brevundimonas sp. AAP58]